MRGPDREGERDNRSCGISNQRAPRSSVQSGPRVEFVVAGCFPIALFGWGLTFYRFGFFHSKLQEIHRGSDGFMSAAVACNALAASVTAVLTGRAIHHHGPAPVLLIGTLGVCGATLLVGLLALMGTGLATWCVAAPFLLAGASFAAMSAQPISAILQRRFDRRSGIRFGIALSGASAGGVIVPMFLAEFSDRIGFVNAVCALGLFGLVLVPTVFFLARDYRPPGAVRDDSDATQGQQEISANAGLPALRSYGAAICIAIGAQIAVFVHIVSALRVSIGLKGAALAVSVAALSAVIGRLLVGALSARWSAPRLAVLCYATQALGTIVMAAFADLTTALVGAVLSGLVLGAIVMLPPILLRTVIDERRLPIVYGWVTGRHNWPRSRDRRYGLD